VTHGGAVQRKGLGSGGRRSEVDEAVSSIAPTTHIRPWIDENFIRNLWFQMGEQVNVKMIRDKFSG
jgi:hypothetical protein